MSANEYVFKVSVLSEDYYAVDKYGRIFYVDKDGKRKEQVTSAETVSRATKLAKLLAKTYNKGAYYGLY